MNQKLDRKSNGSDMEYVEYDNFLHYSSRLLMADVLGDVYVDFSKLKSPNSQFMFTRALLREHKMLIDTLDFDMEYDKPTVSAILRHTGNEFFKAKQYAKAADMYTKCLTGSNPNSESHALALANRSAAYFHMGQFDLCLKDARWAMGSNYPSKTAYKLYGRAGHAERVLGLVERAIRSYAECLTRLNESDMSAEDKREYRIAIEKFANACEQVLAEHKRKTKSPRPDDQLVGGSNEHIPALSAFVELRMSENMERGVYATRDINPGK